MTENSYIAGRIENIKNIFKNAKETASQLNDVNELIAVLENTDPEFKSIAYEGAAMELALKDFAKDNSITQWKELLDLSQKHACQIFIGLGWAIAQDKRTELSFLNNLNINMQFRIWDGCGYYDGFFRPRQTIKSQIRPDYLLAKDFQAYDEGLGRSFWYTCKADVNKITEIINSFSADRRSDLWRGIGIASSYVGGCDETILKTLFTAAGDHRAQLAIGAAMVAKTRTLASAFTNDVDLACTTWCNISGKEATEITLKTKRVENFSFRTFLLQMETELFNKK